MSKAVLISIRPKWCELIASGKKTIEVRKTRPKLETPFKCYIYCTKFHPGDPDSMINLKGKTSFFMPKCGEVIGEFVCDQIEEIAVAFRGGDGPLTARGGNEVWYGGMVEHMSCLSTEAICRYVGGIGRVGFGWHISDLMIYDEPKKLSEFGVNRAPQAWRFIDDSDKRI